MSSPIRVLGLFAAGALLVLAGFVFFTVHESQQALKLQFGAPIGGAINEPGANEAGLKMKLPWQNVVYFDRRNLEFDLRNPLEIIVANEERLLVDAFVRYKITEPLIYFQTLGAGAGSPDQMRTTFNSRLTSVLSESMREVLGAVQVRDVITERRSELMRSIQAEVTEEARKLGVDIIDVRIRQADFPAENAARVYERMESDYGQQAARIRANGDRRAREVTAQADKEEVEILSNAERQAEEIRGRADATRNCIFAGAYQGVPVRIERNVPEESEGDGTVPALDISRPVIEVPRFSGGGSVNVTPSDPQWTCAYIEDEDASGDPQRAEFFAFYRSLTAYEQALGKDDGTTIILSPDSEFFRYFNEQGRGN